MKMSVLLNILCLLMLSGCGGGNSNSDSSPQLPPQEEDIILDIQIDDSDVIWGFDFLPDNRIIYSKRSGTISIFNPATQDVQEVSGVPAVSDVGESGLLDLELHPAFAENNLVYFCYSESRSQGRGMALARGELQNSSLSNVTIVFRTQEANSSAIHFGCRIEFQNNQNLFLSIGDQSEPSEAQNSSSHLGKILRMRDDGSSLEIWSTGHRNVQGLAIRPGTGELFSSEHGPTGGDELNLIQRNGNYGWPLVTRGEPPGPLGESAEGFIDPLISWSPAIAPSGMTFYSGERIPGWRGNLFIATLRGRHIRRIVLEGNTVVEEEELFESENVRFRNIQQGPDGYLWFSTDDGRIGKINSDL